MPQAESPQPAQASQTERTCVSSSNGNSLPETPTVYDMSFWFACLSHAALMTCMSALFRYADFVRFLVGEGGHVEGHLGWIVGVGMVGTLAMRGFQGYAIDHYGPRLVWLASVVILAASLMAHLTVQRVDTPPIYLLRILMMTGIAGAFGSAITFTSLRSPESAYAGDDRCDGIFGVLRLDLGADPGRPAVRQWAADEMAGFRHVRAGNRRGGGGSALRSDRHSTFRTTCPAAASAALGLAPQVSSRGDSAGGHCDGTWDRPAAHVPACLHRVPGN